MSVVTSSLSQEQQKKLLSAGSCPTPPPPQSQCPPLHPGGLHNHCDNQGPSVIVAYNQDGFVFGAYTSKNYSLAAGQVCDEEAFLYSLCPGGNKPLWVQGINRNCAFTNGNTGPHYGALIFLHENAAKIQSNPGINFNFQPAEMHGADLALTEFEVYRVEDA